MGRHGDGEGSDAETRGQGDGEKGSRGAQRQGDLMHWATCVRRGEAGCDKDPGARDGAV